MEIIAQWFDDLDDFVAAVGLLAERLKEYSLALSILVFAVVLEAAAIVLALRHPPLACAIATILFVLLMYRSATAPRKPISVTPEVSPTTA